MTTKLLLNGALLLIVTAALTQSASAQMVGPNAYIKGTSVEIGLDGAGGFEGCNTTVSAPLPGMHFRSNTSYFGFVANPQLNGWSGSAFDGDFFTPGTPENGWGVEIGTAGTSYGNNCNALNQIPGALTNWSHTYTCYSADWQGNLTTGTNLHFKVNYFLQETDLYYTTTVSITNNTAATIADMYYYRNLDPDNNVQVSGDYTTQNTIENEPSSGTCGIALVSATQTNPWNSYLGLAGIGTNFRVGYGGFSNRDASDMWNGVGFTQTPGSTLFVDGAVYLAYRIQNLAPGATETFKFVVILSSAQASNAINNLLYLSYPGSASAPPPACTPYSDTVKICAGVPATIAVQGSIVNDFNWTWSPTTGLSSSTGPSVSAAPTATTTYTLTGTPTSPCVSPVTMTFVVKTSPPSTVVQPPDITTCTGGAVPATVFSSSPAGSTFAWTNSNPAIGLAASGTGNQPAFTATNATGAPITATITVTATIPGGCTGPPVTYTITVNPNLTITVNSATICPTQTATLTATGGSTYVWNTGSTANPYNVSPAVTTSYTVTGSSAGCSGTAVATVTIGGSATITVNSTTVCPGDAAVLTATGGTTYTWNTGSTANPYSVSPTTTTSYTVTGVSGGCTGTAVSTVTVNPTPTTTVPATIVICNGGTTTASGFVSSPAGGTFNWTNSDPSIGLAANGTGNVPAFTAINTGAYAITATITVTPTVNGCIGTPDTYTIMVNPTPAAPTAPGVSVCANTAATLNATAPGGTYDWYDAASAGALLMTGSTYVTPNISTPTNYYVQTTSTAGCVSPMTTVPVTIAAALLVNAGLDDTICYNGNTMLTVVPNGAGYTYSWSPTATLSNGTIYNPVANPSSTTTYGVIVTDPSGCVGSDSVTVFADQQINLAVAGLPTTCFGTCDGQTIVIPSGGSGAFPGYAWSGGCTTPACNQCAGNYTVTVTDSWGCTATNTASVTEPTLLTETIAAPTMVSCYGVCDGSATASVSGGTAAYTYSWNTVPVQTTATASGLCAGTYYCTVTDAHNCTAIDSVVITQPTQVMIAPIANVIICNSGSAVLTALASGGNGGVYSYNWTAATGLSDPTIANPMAAPTTTTTYTVSGADVNGCPALTQTVTVTVNPALSVSTIPVTPVCPAGTIAITATAINGNGGPYAYAWAPATGLSSSTISNPNATPAATTTYTVTATDGCSPAVTSTVTVTVLPLPAPAFSADLTSGCAPLCLNLTDASTISSGSVNRWGWDVNDGANSFANGQTQSHCFNNPGTYSITLIDTSAAGCISTVTYANYITVHSIPVAQFTAPANTSIIVPTVTYTDQSTVDNSSIAAWNWTFGDVLNTTTNTSTQQNPSHLFSDVGTYCAHLVVTSTYGCVDSSDLCVVIDPEFTFYIPNAFSPNGDGINDEFYGKGDFINDFEMTIYDRWGNLIFYTDDINKHWNGTANHGSEIAQMDTYVYVVKLTDYKDKKHKFMGSVTLVK
ncbi:MAG: hypothetical protein JWP12_164 [Bacteroidetes bacterium]|nr:hypothetical protein [Bacteroidota bacterium]